MFGEKLLPLQGGGLLATQKPRAVPWAVCCCPLGASLGDTSCRGLRWVTHLTGLLLFLPTLILRLHNLVGIAGEVLQQLIGGGRGIHANPMLWR